MKNSDIKYKLSTDYVKLYRLLKSGITLIGFIAITLDNKVLKEYSKVTTLNYNAKYKAFDLGFTVFEEDFGKSDFIKLCKNENLRFFDLT